MGQLTPSFLFDLESNMSLVTAREYQRFTANLWWQRVARTMTSRSKKERISWLLDSAKIRETDGGDVTFDDILAQTTEYVNKNASAGLSVEVEEFTDLDGNGVQLATHWSRQMGAYAAYWPQKQLAAAIKANPTTYDGKAFFATDHDLNPFKPGLGTYANLIAAKPIDETNAATVDVALANLVSVVATIANVKMANGEDPRFLKVDGILHPPALTGRVQQLTDAQFIAQAASSGGGSADISGVIRNYGFGEPIEAPELGAAFGGSDTTYYLITSEITSDELGAFTYVNREPFSVVYHGPMTDAKLARMRELQWTTEGRNVIGAGHPYNLFRVDAT